MRFLDEFARAVMLCTLIDNQGGHVTVQEYLGNKGTATVGTVRFDAFDGIVTIWPRRSDSDENVVYVLFDPLRTLHVYVDDDVVTFTNVVNPAAVPHVQPTHPRKFNFFGVTIDSQGISFGDHSVSLGVLDDVITAIDEFAWQVLREAHMRPRIIIFADDAVRIEGGRADQDA